MHPRVSLSLTALTLAVLAQPAAAGFGTTHLSNFDPSDISGYTDLWVQDHPDGRQYAYLGTDNDGLLVVDVTDPALPTEVARIEPPGFEDRRLYDIKTQGVLAFVGMNSVAGLWILDVTDPTNAITLSIDETPTANGIHNLWVDGTHVYAAALDPDPKLVIIDVSDPANPVEVAEWVATESWPHDIVVFDDVAYLSHLGAGLHLLDVSDPANPTPIGDVTYPGAFTHNAWPTANRQHILTSDETCGPYGFLRVFDAADPTSMTEVASWDANSGHTVHNAMIIGDRAYVSWYQDGIRVFDLSDPTAPVEIAQFDTWVGGGGCFAGAWGIWSDDCGLAYGSDMDTGLWIVRVDDVPSCIARPLLRVEAVNFDDACDADPTSPANGNGSADPAETITVRVEIENLGSADATGLVATLATPIPGATVLADTATYDDLAPGATSGPQPGSAFVLQLDADLKCGDVIPLSINLAYGTDMTGPYPVDLAIGQLVEIFYDDFETDQGWRATTSDPTNPILWERAQPIGTLFQPDAGDPRDAGPLCAVTGADAVDDASHDVDDALVTWTSPPIDFGAYDAAVLEFARWYLTNSDSAFMRAELWPDGLNPAALALIGPTSAAWVDERIDLPSALLGREASVAFSVAEIPESGVAEGLVDRVRVSGWACNLCATPAPDLVATTPLVDGDCGATGAADPGEVIELRVPLRNVGGRAATGVQASLVGVPAGVTIRKDWARYADLAAGAERAPLPGDGFAVRIGTSVACGTALDFDIEVTTDTTTFPLTVSITPGGQAVTRSVVFADSFDTDPEAVVPTGWIAESSTTDPTEIKIETDTTIEHTATNSGPLSPPNAVSLGKGQSFRFGPETFDLVRDFDVSAEAATGTLFIQVAEWAYALEEPDQFEILAEDVNTTVATLYQDLSERDSFRNDFGRWTQIEAELTGHGLDLSQPVTVRLRSSVNSIETPQSWADIIYVDDFAIVHDASVAACGPCADAGILLYRADVFSPAARATEFMAMGSDGISLDEPIYERNFVAGPDPHDPAVLLGNVPLIYYQVTDGTSNLGPIHVTKSGDTVDITY